MNNHKDDEDFAIPMVGDDVEYGALKESRESKGEQCPTAARVSEAPSMASVLASVDAHRGELNSANRPRVIRAADNHILEEGDDCPLINCNGALARLTCSGELACLDCAVVIEGTEKPVSKPGLVARLIDLIETLPPDVVALIGKELTEWGEHFDDEKMVGQLTFALDDHDVESAYDIAWAIVHINAFSVEGL